MKVKNQLSQHPAQEARKKKNERRGFCSFSRSGMCKPANILHSLDRQLYGYKPAFLKNLADAMAGSGNPVLQKLGDMHFCQSNGSLTTSTDACLAFDPLGSTRFLTGYLSNLKRQNPILSFSIQIQIFKELHVRSLTECRENGTVTSVTTQK